MPKGVGSREREGGESEACAIKCGFADCGKGGCHFSIKGNEEKKRKKMQIKKLSSTGRMRNA